MSDELAPTDDSGGGLGGNLRANGTRDTRLIERAIREQWPVPDSIRPAVVKRMVRVVRTGKDREATSAARTLVAMTAQNQAGAMKGLDKVKPDLHDHAIADNRQSVAEAIQDADYLEYLYERNMEGHSDTGSVCQKGEPGDDDALAIGESPPRIGPGIGEPSDGKE